MNMVFKDLEEGVKVLGEKQGKRIRALVWPRPREVDRGPIMRGLNHRVRGLGVIWRRVLLGRI